MSILIKIFTGVTNLHISCPYKVPSLFKIHGSVTRQGPITIAELEHPIRYLFSTQSYFCCLFYNYMYFSLLIIHKTSQKIVGKVQLYNKWREIFIDTSINLKSTNSWSEWSSKRSVCDTDSKFIYSSSLCTKFSSKACITEA